VIVQQGVNSYALLGGFAIIAIALVLVVLVVVNSMGDDTSKTSDGAATESAISTEAANVVALPTAITEPTFGQVSYSESEALGDTVSVRVDDLNPPGSGNVYVAWLVNTETDDTLSRGS
jgi:hypothetical protein